ncbi:hypothetical protein, partial [Victivallis vadensis]|uniref:hypothetical protein n=1 Tax=Victivallis vadensis TaxID=172901 RepID=UPI003CFF3B81
VSATVFTPKNNRCGKNTDFFPLPARFSFEITPDCTILNADAVGCIQLSTNGGGTDDRKHR